MTHILQLISAGIVLGFLNTVSSGGSVISLPLLLALGYPAVVANATNRVPVSVGLLIAIWQFQRAGSIPWRSCTRLLPLILIGTFIGTQLSVLIPMSALASAITFAVVMALALLLLNPRRWLDDHSVDSNVLTLSPQLIIILFLVSVWNGFIVLDAGTYLLLSLTLLGGLGLAQANAMKVVLMGASGLFSLLIFSGYSAVNWNASVPLVIGSILGSTIGSKLALGPGAKKWIYWSLVAGISTNLLLKLLNYLPRLASLS
ncbi:MULTISPECIES: sulfite exporter TauE/SafE family protein [unclassified Cyanobium]|uniref:sulfite exporter TauE/SafE family protein n=1 Tax=unclassified Cyanobium TaxID=2627006 RepID=UPI0020CFE4CD|nr:MULTISPECIES: sulfite exporter TauE/SafE family protein [unclassified Cyanobium]MCP9777875.1 sulfite exporter TauE/SafE family protein [Cyanobium sp. Tous-M-B4]MCP9875626.1 sulfite exporter TauE/SafE family protein [Cyanobium sp. A2C-AMD]